MPRKKAIRPIFVKTEEDDKPKVKELTGENRAFAEKYEINIVRFESIREECYHVSQGEVKECYNKFIAKFGMPTKCYYDTNREIFVGINKLVENKANRIPGGLDGQHSV